MSSKELMVSGKPLSSLRVVDLKEELEKRGLSKSGSKKDLAERLRMNILIENQRESHKNDADDEQLPNISMREQLADQNPFIRDYFQSQAELFHSQKVVKKLYEGMSHTTEAVAQNLVMTKEDNSSRASASPVKIIPVATPPPPPLVVVSPPIEHVQIQPRATRARHQEQAEIIKVQNSQLAVENLVMTKQQDLSRASVSPVKVISVVATPPPPPAPVVESSSESESESEPEVEQVQQKRQEIKVQNSQREEQNLVVTKEVIPTRASVSQVKAIPVARASVSPVKAIPVAVPSPPPPAPVVESSSDSESEPEPEKVQQKEPVEIKVPEAQQEKMVVTKEVNSTRASVSPVKAMPTPPPVVVAPAESSDSEPEPEPEKIQQPAKQQEEQVKVQNSQREDVVMPMEVDSSRKSTSPVKVIRTTPPPVPPGESSESEDEEIQEQAKKRRQEQDEVQVPKSQQDDEKIQPEPVKSSELKRKELQRHKRILSLPSDDVEEALDYGDEESRLKKEHDEVSWTRRILRLRNRCAVIEKTEKKWSRSDRKPVVVTSNVLETFFPDVKLLPDSEVKLEEKTPVEPERTPKAVERTHEPLSSLEEKAETKLEEPNVVNVKRKISIIPFDESVKELTPPRNPPSNVLIITNLVRPFTLLQLKEMLQRTGKIVDIWVDKIKSKCIAKFEKKEEAEETRAALHGVTWPISNPKALIVDYTTDAEFEDHRTKETGEHKIKVEKPSEANKGIPVREWDLGKRERSRSRSVSGRRRRSGSDTRKRSRKSPSPHLRRHSRSPHHDKKSLRDLESKEEAQGKALDELFRKTTTTPCIYWLPLTPEQISEKEEMRRKRMIERERRLAQIEMAKERQHIRPR